MAMKTGPKKLFNDPRDFQTAVNRYFDKCKEEGVFPDYPGMLVDLNLFESDIERLLKQSNRYREILDRAELMRQSWLERTMVTNKAAANGCMNALKQEHNGGYIDRPKADKGQAKVTIEVSGIGGSSLFKG